MCGGKAVPTVAEMKSNGSPRVLPRRRNEPNRGDTTMIREAEEHLSEARNLLLAAAAYYPPTCREAERWTRVAHAIESECLEDLADGYEDDLSFLPHGGVRSATKDADTE